MARIEGRLGKKMPTLGARDETFVEILSGLEEGDEVLDPRAIRPSG